MGKGKERCEGRDNRIEEDQLEYEPLNLEGDCVSMLLLYI